MYSLFYAAELSGIFELSYAVTNGDYNIQVIEGYFIQTFSLLRYDCKFCNCTFFLKFTFGINVPGAKVLQKNEIRK